MLIGLAMSQAVAVAIIHVALVVAAVFWVTFLSKKLESLIFVAAYVVGADVLWRLTVVAAPYELGKHLLVVVLMAALIRFIRHPRRIGTPLFYLAALTPSVLMVIFHNPPTWSREMFSQVMMGPVVLGVGVIVFRQLIVSRGEMVKVLWSCLGVIIAISTVVLVRVIEAGDIEFRSMSNATTSGGFGPNQVSTVLGFGAVVCLLLFLAIPSLKDRIGTLILGVLFLGQSIFTFSRGGLYSAVGAIAAIAVAALIASRLRSRMLWVAVFGVLGFLVLFNFMDGKTDGMLGLRVADRTTTNRGEIASGDVELFRKNPIFGVGMGESKVERFTPGLTKSNAHTEATRLLAEHGILGLAAIAAVLVMFVDAIKSADTDWNRLIAVGFGVWSLISSSHSAMRIALIPFVFAMTAIRVGSEELDPGSAQ